MPDPLSITSGVVSLVVSTIRALQKYNDLRVRYESFDLSILSAKTQCDCILTALNKIQDTLLSRPSLAQRWTLGEQLAGRNLQSIMGACELTFGLIQEKLKDLLSENVDKYGLATRRARITSVWKESDISMALSQISSLTPALNLLLTALNTESQAEVMDLLTNERSRTIFSKVSTNAESIRDGRGGRSNAPTNEMSQDEIENQDFTFDSLVLNTSIYKKAFVTAKKKKPRPKVYSERAGHYDHWYLAKAMHSFDADPSSYDQISVSKSETVEVSKIEETWWRVKKDTGERGVIPRNYLCLFDAHLEPHEGLRRMRDATPSDSIRTRDEPLIVKAVYPYKANPAIEEELSFEEGETLQVTEKMPGWYNATKNDGKVGVVPSPYFILTPKARPVPPASSLPSSYSQVELKSQDIPAKANIGDPLDFLDNLQIAHAVLTVADSTKHPNPVPTPDTENFKQKGTASSRQKAKGKERLQLPYDELIEPEYTGLCDGDIQNSIDAACLDLAPDPDRFVSPSEFQSILLSFLRESTFEENKWSMSKSKLEAWVNWIMANPADEDLNLVEMYGLEDEIRSTVLPQLVGFEEEHWGNRNTGAVLDAWCREAISRGAINEGVLRDSVRDLLTLWQDSASTRGGRVSFPMPTIVEPSSE
ncbi:Transmembrane osmosensor [Lecanora helva]